MTLYSQTDSDPILTKACVVYKIPCSCNLAYIRETKRYLGTWLKEHQAATRRGEVEKSAIAEHAWKEQHHPLWDNISILDQSKNVTSLRIKEALHISLAGQHTLLNRDQGVNIADCWRPLLLRSSTLS